MQKSPVNRGISICHRTPVNACFTGGRDGLCQAVLDAGKNLRQSKRPGARNGSRPLPGGASDVTRTRDLLITKAIQALQMALNGHFYPFSIAICILFGSPCPTGSIEGFPRMGQGVGQFHGRQRKFCGAVNKENDQVRR